MKNIYYLILLLPLITSCEGNQKQQITPEAVIEIIHKVNQHWQSTNPTHGDAFWHRAAYHTGNIEAFEVTGCETYWEYSEVWATQNLWQGARSDTPEEWKYSYGETDEYVLFGDWQTCFQVYADLYKYNPEPRKIARAIEVMEYQMDTSQNDYWWWADGIYMVMPVMPRLYHLTGNKQYLEKMDEYFTFAKELMYDPEECLFYRDANFIYPKHKTLAGKKDFWSRGNGWVLAAYARVLKLLPADHPTREEYITLFKDMANTLKNCQHTDGYWTRSLLDEAQADGPETSGSAFFLYGLLWGVNNNLLDESTYLPTIEKGWKYLTLTALQPDGSIGYVQPIGASAIPGQVLDRHSTADFGVGAFLLAASEMYKYSVKQ